MGLKTNSQPTLTLQERLDAGNLTVDEVLTLRNRSRTGFYADLKQGLVSIRKIGRKTVIPGPVARAYIAGLPIPSDPEVA